MDKSDIIRLDIKKIHNEITLIISQRFQLTIFATLVFIGYCTWTIVDAFNLDTDTFSKLTMINNAYLLILFFIYIYYVSLMGPMYTLSGYLIAMKYTQWEIDLQGIGTDPRFQFPVFFTSGKFFFLLGIFSILLQAADVTTLLVYGKSYLWKDANFYQHYGLVINVVLGSILLLLSAVYTKRLSRSGDKFSMQWEKYLTRKPVEPTTHLIPNLSSIGEGRTSASDTVTYPIR